MNLGKITVITPPDKLHNLTLSYLLVKPSKDVKHQFQTILSHSIDDLNVFIFDDDDTDIDWLLSVANQADVTVIDVDNCDPITKKFVTFMLAGHNVHYITSDELTPYNLINKNRIYDLNQIIDQILGPEDDDIEEEDDDASQD